MPRRSLDPLDRFTLGYGAVLALTIGATVTSLTTGIALLALNTTVASLACFVLPSLRARQGVSRFLGIILPLLVFYLFYRETGLGLASPDIAWMDSHVARFEMAMWGQIGSEESSRFLGEILAFSYMAYVPLLLGVATLLMHRDAGDRAAETMVHRISISWGICYILFLLIPVTGPRFLFDNVQEAHMGTGVFSAIASLNQDYGMLRGGAFPSAHVAATAIATWSLWRSRRKFFWALLPLCVAVPVGAVYLGYHYIIDVVAGVAVTGLAVASERAISPKPRSRNCLAAEGGSSSGAEIP